MALCWSITSPLVTNVAYLLLGICRAVVSENVNVQSRLCLTVPVEWYLNFEPGRCSKCSDEHLFLFEAITPKLRVERYIQ